MEEIWVPIDGFENYEVSNFGNVMNATTGRILKKSLGVDRNEYVNLYQDGCGYCKLVRRLVAEAFLEKPHDGIHEYVVTNIDFDRSNNRVDNVEYITKAESIQRSFRHGRKQTHTMRAIRCIETGETYPSIVACSEAMGLSTQAISRCVNNSVLHTKDGYHFEPID